MSFAKPNDNHSETKTTDNATAKKHHYCNCLIYYYRRTSGSNSDRSKDNGIGPIFKKSS